MILRLHLLYAPARSIRQPLLIVPTLSASSHPQLPGLHSHAPQECAGWASSGDSGDERAVAEPRDGRAHPSVAGRRQERVAGAAAEADLDAVPADGIGAAGPDELVEQGVAARGPQGEFHARFVGTWRVPRTRKGTGWKDRRPRGLNRGRSASTWKRPSGDQPEMRGRLRTAAHREPWPGAAVIRARAATVRRESRSWRAREGRTQGFMAAEQPGRVFAQGFIDLQPQRESQRFGGWRPDDSCGRKRGIAGSSVRAIAGERSVGQ